MQLDPRSLFASALAEYRDGAIGIAVSGGGDSLALLDLAYRCCLGPRLRAVTLDHGLRPEAADEAQMVSGFAAARGIPHQVLRWTDWDGTGNLQAEARAARYRLISDWAHAQDVAEVWVGHTQDDVAETFLIRLGRSAGLDGLSQMAPVFRRHGVVWRRPLLGVSREALRGHLRDAGIAWAEDPSNQDLDYTRVRMRQALVGLSEIGLGPEVIARSAAALASSRQMIDEVMAREWADRVRLHGGDLVLSLDGAGAEVTRRLVLSALQWVGGGAWPPRQSAYQGLIEGLQKGQQTLAGCLVRSSGHMMRIMREYQTVRGLTANIYEVWDGRWDISAPPTEMLEAGLYVKALGQGIVDCPNWRETGLPRASLMASPAIWQGERLIAAPLAGKLGGWAAKLRPSFATRPFAH